ncbi:MAG TPA: hypothetical protein QGF58_19620 [Myxococcota bacterium]|nr:hypothetical protein [Myxococcota bacterium]
MVTFIAGVAVGYGVLYLSPGDDQPQGGPAPDDMPSGELPPPGPDALPPLKEGVVDEIPIDVPRFEPPKDEIDDGSSELRTHLSEAAGLWSVAAEGSEGELAATCHELASTAEALDPGAPPVNEAARFLLAEHEALERLAAAGVAAEELQAQVDALRLD